MSGEQKRNIDLANIGSKQVNEFEYQKHQGEITQQEHPGQQKGAAPSLTRAEQVARITAAAHKKVEKRRKKEGAKTAEKKSAAKSSKKSSKKATSKTSKKSGATKGKKKR